MQYNEASSRVFTDDEVATLEAAGPPSRAA
jgi:hypothetical protein